MKRFISVIVVCVMVSVVILGGCKNGDVKTRITDERTLTNYEYTLLNLSATDKEGRSVRLSDAEIKDSFVGLFYHIWLGNDHTRNYKRVYDITQLLKNDPDSLWDIRGNDASPVGSFHHWGEPLYGYYCSSDPYVLRRHAELLTMAGVDYLVFDTTNSYVYAETVNALLEIFKEYHDMGWKVPKLAFYCNTHSSPTMRTIYENWYKDGRYNDLWFSLDGEKPLIIGALNELTEAQYELYSTVFDMRSSQWPYGMNADYENGFPWMDWDYPQKNYNGTMSVSLAQHPGARMSQGRISNNGRGFDYATFRNKSSNTALGTNFAGQFATVFKNNSDPTAKKVNNVFITGFNEWKAIKYQDGESVFFVDTFNEEYSRDIEMMKGGYADNYYLQMSDYIKAFKYTEVKRYKYNVASVDINDATFAGFARAARFSDFTGEAAIRNYSDAFGTTTYVDNSGRNDIKDVYVVHDKDYLYIKAETVNDIVAYNGTDENWMTVLLSTEKSAEKSFGGYDFIINRSPKANGKTSLEKSVGGYNWVGAGEAEYRVYKNAVVYRIPLSALGLSENSCYVKIKVNDNITKYDDIMDYYVSGDSAPIGRLGYVYGY